MTEKNGSIVKANKYSQYDLAYWHYYSPDSNLINLFSSISLKNVFNNNTQLEDIKYFQCCQ